MVDTNLELDERHIATIADCEEQGTTHILKYMIWLIVVVVCMYMALWSHYCNGWCLHPVRTYLYYKQLAML